MYIVELFLKIKEDFRLKQGIFKKFQKYEKNDTLNEDNEEIGNERQNCDHIFVPIDSTGNVLACTKCGEIYKLKKGEVNPFKNA